MKKLSLVPVERIEQSILLIRGQKVMLDADLAELYGTTTKRLNEQVKRNRERFPEDFMCQLTAQEKREVVAICDHLKRLKFSPVRPCAFTEHGELMAANVLNSKQAVEVSVFIIRAFVRLRQMLATHKELAAIFAELERRVTGHDHAIQSLVVAIKRLMNPPLDRRKGKIGFRASRSHECA